MQIVGEDALETTLAEQGLALTEATLEELRQELLALRADLVAHAAELHAMLDKVHPRHQASARNLLHYLALRRRDLRPLQLRLAALGLSSLGRAESHVLATLDAVLAILHRLCEQPWEPPSDEASAAVSFASSTVSFATGPRLLAEHAQALLGPPDPQRGVRIMVTMPSEAADQYSLIHDLLRQGMNAMRINCAHDDVPEWQRMIAHLRRAEQALGRSCQVVMDLGGPKLRTGPVEPGPAVVRVKPNRNEYGQVSAPARIWLTSNEGPARAPSAADAQLRVPGAWLRQLVPGDDLRLIDARDSNRVFRVVDATAGGCWAECRKTAYLAPGTVLRLARSENDDPLREAILGELPAREGQLTFDF